MSFRRRKRSICFLIIFILMFLGMCFESSRADALFSDTFFTEEREISSEASTLSAVGNFSFSDQIYLKETLENQEIVAELRQTAQRQGMRLTQRLQKGSGLVWVSVSVLLLLFAGKWFLIWNGLLQEALSNIVIIGYIHQKDGKKA